MPTEIYTMTEIDEKITALELRIAVLEAAQKPLPDDIKASLIILLDYMKSTL